MQCKEMKRTACSAVLSGQTVFSDILETFQPFRKHPFLQHRLNLMMMIWFATLTAGDGDRYIYFEHYILVIEGYIMVLESFLLVPEVYMMVPEGFQNKY